MAPRKIRGKVVKKTEDCRCLVCGLDIPDALDSSHVISQALLNKLPEPHRKFFDQDGINAIHLCVLCHRLYDRGLLPDDDFRLILPYLRNALYELAHHLDNVLPEDKFRELEAFLELHDYEQPRESDSEAQQAKRREKSNKRNEISKRLKAYRR